MKRNGQTTVEYMLIVAVIVVVISVLSKKVSFDYRAAVPKSVTPIRDLQ